MKLDTKVLIADIIILTIAAVTITALLAAGIANAVPPGLFASPLGNVPNSADFNVRSNDWGNSIGALSMRVPLPAGATAYTVTCWVRQRHNAKGDAIAGGYGGNIVSSFYTFDPCGRSKTAFMSEAGQGPRVFTDALPATRDFTQDPPQKNIFSNGVFAVSLEVDGIATLTVADTTVTVTNSLSRNFQGRPGQRSISIQCGPSAAWTLNVAECPIVRFYGRENGTSAMVNGIPMITADSVITNEFVMLSYRVRLEGGSHYYRSDMMRIGGGPPSGETSIFDYPPVVNVTADTMFFIRTMDMQASGAAHVWELWNVRVRGRWLSDDELVTIRDADVRAMGRLGIGRWHTGITE